MENIILAIKDVSKYFSAGKDDCKVIDQVSINFYKNDFTVIMGPSGAGKSTLLYAISGMEKISEGAIFYNNKEISQMSEKQLAQIRAKDFGFVFQQANLVSNLTLEENVYVAGYMCKENKEKIVKERADNLLSKMKVTTSRKRLPSEVSGGEAQRAAVARAVINSPSILFADEPTGALNKQNTKEVLDIFTEMHNAGQNIIMVTHDIRAAIRGNRILYLEDGQIKGELALEKYKIQDAREREDKINTWLTSMEW